jgi:hypothetical protein
LEPGPVRRPREYERPPDQSALGNPYVIAGLAVAGAIVMAVLIVVLFGGGGGGGAGDGNGDENASIDPLTAQPGTGLVARSIATATVREGPSTEFIEIGTLRSGQDIEVLGRDDSARWFLIVFPPRSTLNGWVQASALRIPEASVNGIPVLATTPIPRPTVVLPTSTPGPTETATPNPTATGTAAPAGVSDLAASAVAGSCRNNRELEISVRNLGPSPLIRAEITILVQTAQGQQRAIARRSATLDVNEEIEIDTGYELDNNERVVAIVDPLGALRDPNANNNRVDCIVGTGGGGATPTNTPRAGNN